MIYRDSHHVTATYARTLMPVIREQLKKMAAWSALTSS